VQHVLGRASIVTTPRYANLTDEAVMREAQRNRVRVLKFLVVAWLGACCLADFAAACTCEPTTAAARLGRSTDVFVGTVLSATLQRKTVTTYRGTMVFSRVRATIRVDRSWKGPLRDVVEVVTNGEASMCGVDFQQGLRYLVFAARESGEMKATLMTSICNGSRRVRWTAEAIDSLGPPSWMRGAAQ